MMILVLLSSVEMRKMLSMNVMDTIMMATHFALSVHVDCQVAVAGEGRIVVEAATEVVMVMDRVADSLVQVPLLAVLTTGSMCLVC